MLVSTILRSCKRIYKSTLRRTWTSVWTLSFLSFKISEVVSFTSNSVRHQTLYIVIGFAKRKNFSKPIDKFRIMCYYVILRIYLLGFPWYDYIITQFYVFVNTFNTYFCVSMFLTIVRMCFCGFLWKIKSWMSKK